VGYVLECAEEVMGLKTTMLPRLRRVLNRSGVTKGDLVAAFRKHLRSSTRLSVSPAQLAAVMASTQCHLSSHVTQQVFRALDHNNNRRISYVEFASLCFDDGDSDKFAEALAKRMLQRATVVTAFQRGGSSGGGEGGVLQPPASMLADVIEEVEGEHEEEERKKMRKASPAKLSKARMRWKGGGTAAAAANAGAAGAQRAQGVEEEEEVAALRNSFKITKNKLRQQAAAEVALQAAPAAASSAAREDATVEL
jgi:hypothetical protein